MSQDYPLSPTMNCFKVLPMLDGFDIKDTKNKTITIDFKHCVAKINTTYTNITEKQIKEERIKLYALCSEYNIDSSAIILKVLLALGLDIDGDVVQLATFIKTLSSVKYQLFEKGE